MGLLKLKENNNVKASNPTFRFYFGYHKF
jgi:hypothetical protein